MSKSPGKTFADFFSSSRTDLDILKGNGSRDGPFFRQVQGRGWKVRSGKLLCNGCAVRERRVRRWRPGGGCTGKRRPPARGASRVGGGGRRAASGEPSTGEQAYWADVTSLLPAGEMAAPTVCVVPTASDQDDQIVVDSKCARTEDGSQDRKKRCHDRYDSSESSDRSVLFFTATKTLRHSIFFNGPLN